MLLSYKPVHLQAQQRLQEEGCVVDINYLLQFTFVLCDYSLSDQSLTVAFHSYLSYLSFPSVMFFPHHVAFSSFMLVVPVVRTSPCTYLIKYGVFSLCYSLSPRHCSLSCFSPAVHIIFSLMLLFLFPCRSLITFLIKFLSTKSHFRCCVWDPFKTFTRIFESPIHPPLGYILSVLTGAL